MNKNNFMCMAICLLGLISTTHAEVPSDKTIISWIGFVAQIDER